MNSKEIVLKEMFGENKDYAGYDNIVESLVTKGKCLTTNQVSGKFIGGIWNFVKENKDPIEDGVGLIEFVLDKDEVYKSGLFEEYRRHILTNKMKELNRLKADVEKLQEFISYL